MNPSNNFSLQMQDDGAYKVCLNQDGFQACTYVSSMHLVYDKQPQLKAVVAKLAADAYKQDAS